MCLNKQLIGYFVTFVPSPFVLDCTVGEERQCGAKFLANCKERHGNIG